MLVASAHDMFGIPMFHVMCRMPQCLLMLTGCLTVSSSSLGLDGAAIANVLVTIVEAIMLLCFMLHREHRLARSSESTWHGW